MRFLDAISPQQTDWRQFHTVQVQCATHILGSSSAPHHPAKNDTRLQCTTPQDGTLGRFCAVSAVLLRDVGMVLAGAGGAAQIRGEGQGAAAGAAGLQRRREGAPSRSRHPGTRGLARRRVLFQPALTRLLAQQHASAIRSGTPSPLGFRV